MQVELQDNELQAVWDAVDYFIANARSLRRNYMRDARLVMFRERLRVALDAQKKAAVKDVTHD